MFRKFSLPRLLGLGDDRPAPERAGSADFLDPYGAAEVELRPDVDGFMDEMSRAAGEHFRRQYADTPLFGESVAATGTEPHNSQAGVQAWKGAVR